MVFMVLAIITRYDTGMIPVKELFGNRTRLANMT